MFAKTWSRYVAAVFVIGFALSVCIGVSGNMALKAAGVYEATYTIPGAIPDGGYTVLYTGIHNGNNIYAEDRFQVGHIDAHIDPKDIWDYILDCNTPLIPLSAGWHLFQTHDLLEILVALYASNA